MRCANFFEQYRLTGDQHNMAAALDDFFEGNADVFLLRGYAGTGKTFMIKGIADFLIAEGRQVILAAPTGRASQILQEKSGHQASTIHRLLYAGEHMRDTDKHNGEEYDVLKIFYGVESNPYAADAVFIIDEASMVSNAFNENDLLKFGSGYLLNDLIQYVFPDPAGGRRRIIFSGDSAQLPPVDMAISPALDVGYLQQNYHLKVMESELREVVRQDQRGTILGIATSLREAIRQNRYGLPALKQGGDVTFIEGTQLVDRFLERAGSQYDQAVVIAHSNRMVYAMNQAIRRQLYPGSGETPVPGDRLVVVKNNYLYSKELLNGETGTLLSINNQHIHEHRVEVRLPNKTVSGDRLHKVTLRFREAVIRFTGAEGSCDIRCMIVDNVLFSGRRDLTYIENVALLVDFKQRWGQGPGKSRDFRMALREDPFFNALRVKFGYALTCHKAQGGEWKDALVNCRTMMGYNTEAYMRWFYTAVTRAAKHLLLIDPPDASETRMLKEAGRQKEGQGPVSGKPAETQGIGNNETADFEKSLAGSFVKQLEQQGYIIHEPELISYGFQFLIEDINCRALIRVFYNRRKVVTKIEALNSKGFDLTVIRRIFDFAGIPEELISCSEQSVTGRQEGSSPQSTDFIEEFKQKVMEAVASAGILLAKTESYAYHELFYFRKIPKYATIKFYYNKKQQWTRYEVIQPQSNGLQAELIPLLKNMMS
ncbi:ATP-dependent RecD-like DNA helicase [anaerobic digester metagenome]